MTIETVPATPAKRNPVTLFLFQNRRALSALVIFLVMLGIFTLANPKVFLSPITYKAVFISVPITVFLIVPMVFVITAGEIDLSFPATVGITSWMFASALQSGWDPFLALIPAIVAGLVTGLAVGILVTYVGLSSLVATLGMNYLLRGLINIGTEGVGKQFPTMRDTALYQLLAGRIDNLPVQVIWAVVFVIIGWALFNRHKFGAHIHFVGDNADSAREMGINVERVKIAAYVFMGFGAAMAGVLSVLVNLNWWPTTGDGLLLPALASVFIGGTPTWGGIGTVVGSAVGGFITAFIETGIIASGLTGFFTQFFHGLIIIVSLIGHRFNGPRYR